LSLPGKIDIVKPEKNESNKGKGEEYAGEKND
jgi:hypothetical protein